MKRSPKVGGTSPLPVASTSKTPATGWDRHQPLNVTERQRISLDTARRPRDGAGPPLKPHETEAFTTDARPLRISLDTPHKPWRWCRKHPQKPRETEAFTAERRTTTGNQTGKPILERPTALSNGTTTFEGPLAESGFHAKAKVSTSSQGINEPNRKPRPMRPPIRTDTKNPAARIIRPKGVETSSPIVVWDFAPPRNQ